MEEKLISEYIGDKKDFNINSKVNWIAAASGEFMGPVWFFYRKSNLVGVIFIVITYIVSIIATAINIEEVHYIMFFVYLFLANKLYLWDVKRKVHEILETNNNLSESELVKIVQEKGGTSKKALIVYIVALILFIVIYLLWFLKDMAL